MREGVRGLFTRYLNLFPENNKELNVMDKAVNWLFFLFLFFLYQHLRKCCTNEDERVDDRLAQGRRAASAPRGGGGDRPNERVGGRRETDNEEEMKRLANGALMWP